MRETPRAEMERNQGRDNWWTEVEAWLGPQSTSTPTYNAILESAHNTTSSLPPIRRRRSSHLNVNPRLHENLANANNEQARVHSLKTLRNQAWLQSSGPGQLASTHPLIMQEEFGELGRGEDHMHGLQSMTPNKMAMSKESRDATSPTGKQNCPSGCVESVVPDLNVSREYTNLHSRHFNAEGLHNVEECRVGTSMTPLRVPQYLVHGYCSMNDCEEVIWECGMALESWIDESNQQKMLRVRFGDGVEKMVPVGACVFTSRKEANAPPHDEHLYIEIDHDGVLQWSQDVYGGREDEDKRRQKNDQT